MSSRLAISSSRSNDPEGSSPLTIMSLSADTALWVIVTPTAP